MIILTQSPHHQKLEIQLNQWKLLSDQISAEKCTIRKKESSSKWPMKDFVRKTVHARQSTALSIFFLIMSNTEYRIEIFE